MPPVDITTAKRKYKTLGALAKGMRIKKHLTQREVADYCMLSTYNVRCIENNEYQANYCYDYIFALGQMRNRRIKRTAGGTERAGRKVRRRRKRSK